MIKLNPIMISGKEVLPLIEGGKGINASDGRSSGAWAHENCVGTFSGVSPDFYDENGNVIIEHFYKKKRADRHEEMVEYAIKGGVAQAQVAHEVSGGNGRIHMNMLWELADSDLRCQKAVLASLCCFKCEICIGSCRKYYYTLETAVLYIAWCIMKCGCIYLNACSCRYKECFNLGSVICKFICDILLASDQQYQICYCYIDL